MLTITIIYALIQIEGYNRFLNTKYKVYWIIFDFTVIVPLAVYWGIALANLHG